MWALTLTQPWAWMVIYGSKDIENRGWTNSIVSDLIRTRHPFVVHAGARMPRIEYERAVAYAAEQDPELVVPSPEKLVLGAVLGTAVIASVHTPFEWSPHRRWHMKGQCGWQLVERKPFHWLIDRKGKQGFWTIEDAAIADAMRPTLRGVRVETIDRVMERSGRGK